jgi:hypothetical protein
MSRAPIERTLVGMNTTLTKTGHIHRNRWLTVLTAMATATAGWGIAHSLLGVELTVGDGDSLRHIDSLAVTLTALGVGFAAWGLLFELERHTVRARTIWTRIAVGVLAVSLLGPLGATTGSAMAALVILHLLVGGILIYGMRR